MLLAVVSVCWRHSALNTLPHVDCLHIIIHGCASHYTPPLFYMPDSVAYIHTMFLMKIHSHFQPGFLCLVCEQPSFLWSWHPEDYKYEHVYELNSLGILIKIKMVSWYLTLHLSNIMVWDFVSKFNTCIWIISLFWIGLMLTSSTGWRHLWFYHGSSLLFFGWIQTVRPVN